MTPFAPPRYKFATLRYHEYLSYVLVLELELGLVPTPTGQQRVHVIDHSTYYVLVLHGHYHQPWPKHYVLLRTTNHGPVTPRAAPHVPKIDALCYNTSHVWLCVWRCTPIWSDPAVVPAYLHNDRLVLVRVGPHPVAQIDHSHLRGWGWCLISLFWPDKK